MSVLFLLDVKPTSKAYDVGADVAFRGQKEVTGFIREKSANEVRCGRGDAEEVREREV